MKDKNKIQREFVKAKVMILYPDKVQENIVKLCGNCIPPFSIRSEAGSTHKCKLLPVTSTGEDCPYYQEEK